MTLGVITSLVAPLAATSALIPTFAATPLAGTGQMITNGDTLPYGAAWLDDQTAQGGHLWVTDQVLGVCRIDPAPAANPPFARTNCNGTTKAGGQIVVGDTPTTATDGSKYMYVADNGSKSTQVVRFKFDPKTGLISSPLSINAQNLNQKGGGGVKTAGAAGGRPSGIALVPNKTNPNDDDLYVSYLKSGDIIKVNNVKTATATPAQSAVNLVGSTSDGRGVNNALYFNGTLYLAEVGGAGLSAIQDPNGLNRAACTNAVQCTATTVSPVPSFFPGGLAADPTNTYIYIGDAPRASANSILRYNPANGQVDSYSTNVTTYTWTDSAGNHTTNQYWAPFGLGVNPHTGDVYVGDDPTQGLPAPGATAPTTTQGHIWKIAAPAAGVTPTGPAVTSITPVSGTTAGGDLVTITGTGFTPDTVTATGPVAASSVFFGTVAGTNVSCTATQCTATSPAGTGTVDVRVQANGQESPVVAADKFTYVAPAAPAGFAVQSVSPTSGFSGGGSPVTIQVNNVPTGATLSVNFGPGAATNVNCTPPPAGSTSVTTTCVVDSPAGTGTVDVQVTANTGTPTGQTTPISPSTDSFTYVGATANLYAWGITAPKGGAIWLQGTTAGHWWSSDHAQGICRQDLVPGSTSLHALNFGMCGDDAVGSAGQAVVDPRPIPGALNANLRYVYVPDNAVRSTAVWRLTFDPAGDGGNGAMVPDPFGGATATAMTPLADVRTLKPNGMAIGPLLPPDPTTGKLPVDPVTLTPQVAANASLYVTDLTEAGIRAITNPNANDPRTQQITVVAQTGDARGANGTAGFVGNLLYISENRGTSFFQPTAPVDATGNAAPQCPMAGGPCGTIKIPLQTNAAGIFVAGSATDPFHGFVYSSDSPGGANATVYRYDAHSDTYAPFVAGSAGANPTCGVPGVPSGCVVGAPGPIFVTGGTLPATGVAVTCAVPSAASATSAATTGCERPWDAVSHPTTAAGFSFAFGMETNPTNGNLIITEDPTAGNRSGRGSMWEVPFVN